MKSLATVHIVGAGPAGLTAAYALVRRGVMPTVLEADSTVGGIARTVEHKGFRFDIGGHRFFTKVKAVDTACGTRSCSGDESRQRTAAVANSSIDGQLFRLPVEGRQRGPPARTLGSRKVRILASYTESATPCIRHEKE